MTFGYEWRDTFSEDHVPAFQAFCTRKSPRSWSTGCIWWIISCRRIFYIRELQFNIHKSQICEKHDRHRLERWVYKKKLLNPEEGVDFSTYYLVSRVKATTLGRHWPLGRPLCPGAVSAHKCIYKKNMYTCINTVLSDPKYKEMWGGGGQIHHCSRLCKHAACKTNSKNAIKWLPKIGSHLIATILWKLYPHALLTVKGHWWFVRINIAFLLSILLDRIVLYKTSSICEHTWPTAHLTI
jgi:hypothetical protein